MVELNRACAIVSFQRRVKIVRGLANELFGAFRHRICLEQCAVCFAFTDLPSQPSCKVWPSRRELRPYERQLRREQKVLGDRHREVEINHCVPPSGRDEDCLAWPLDVFLHAKRHGPSTSFEP